MSQFLHRQAQLNVDGLLLRTIAGGLDIGFRVEKTTEPEPNECEITILGLNASHRRQLGVRERVPVLLEAGYEGQLGQLFLGDLRRAHSERQQGWVTTIEGGDGEKATKTKRVAESFGAKTRLTTVLRAAAKALGVGEGNLETAAAKARWLDGGADFRNGTTLHGSPADELTRILSAVGLEWSILDGELQILEHGRPLGTGAVLLSPSTGLVGAPSIETKDGDKTFVMAKSLLNAALQPGALVQVEHPDLSAIARVDRVVFTGETSGIPWYADIVGRVQ